MQFTDADFNQSALTADHKPATVIQIDWKARTVTLQVSGEPDAREDIPWTKFARRHGIIIQVTS